jgi:hypothetical protein
VHSELDLHMPRPRRRSDPAVLERRELALAALAAGRGA